MPRLLLSILSRLLVGTLVVFPIYSCSQDQEVQRLRLAFSLFLYQQDVKETTLVAEVTPLYKKGERLAVSLKEHLAPADLPIYQEHVEQTYQAKDKAQEVLNRKRQAVEQAAHIYKEKKQAYEEAEEADRQAFRERERFLKENIGINIYKNKDYLRINEKLNRAHSIRRDAKREYSRSEEEYIQAQKAEEDAEIEYIQSILHAWDWLDLYVEQLIQDGDARE